MTQLDCGGEPIGGPTGGQGRRPAKTGAQLHRATAAEPTKPSVRSGATSESLRATLRNHRLLRRRLVLRGLDVRRATNTGALSRRIAARDLFRAIDTGEGMARGGARLLASAS